MIKFLIICLLCVTHFLCYAMGKTDGWDMCKKLYELEIHHFNSRKAVAMMRRYTKKEKEYETD